MTPQQIALISFTRLGDLIQTVPFLRRLRARHPDAIITLVVNEAFAEAARRLPCVSKVMSFPLDALVPQLDTNSGNLSSAAKLLREFLHCGDLQSADEVYNLSHTKLSASLCSLLNTRHMHGYVRNEAGGFEIHGRWFAYLFSILENRTYNPYNLTEIYARFAEHSTAGNDLEFRVSEEDRRDAAQLLAQNGIAGNKPLLALQPGASTTDRQWPAACFGELARLMGVQGWQTIVLGTASERALADSVEQFSQSHAVSLAGRTGIGTLAAVLERAQRLVSNDTGTIHVAAAVKTPSVGIYLGPASAKETAPYAGGHFILEADLDCAPCRYREKCEAPACASQIEVDDVVELLLNNSARGTISHARRARAYCTEVTASGEFRLHPLNSPATTTVGDITAFYRRFWDWLLIETERPSPFNGDIVTEQVKRLNHLNAICQEGRQILLRLLSAQGAGSARDANQLLADLLTWQKGLHSEMNKHAVTQPLIQYVLVRMTAAGTNNLNDYLHDVHHALSDLERGLELFTRREVEARAEA